MELEIGWPFFTANRTHKSEGTCTLGKICPQRDCSAVRYAAGKAKSFVFPAPMNIHAATAGINHTWTTFGCERCRLSISCTTTSSQCVQLHPGATSRFPRTFGMQNEFCVCVSLSTKCYAVSTFVNASSGVEEFRFIRASHRMVDNPQELQYTVISIRMGSSGRISNSHTGVGGVGSGPHH